jgi:hypothetical protein
MMRFTSNALRESKVITRSPAQLQLHHTQGVEQVLRRLDAILDEFGV